MRFDVFTLPSNLFTCILHWFIYLNIEIRVVLLDVNIKSSLGGRGGGRAATLSTGFKSADRSLWKEGRGDASHGLQIVLSPFFVCLLSVHAEQHGDINKGR